MIAIATLVIKPFWKSVQLSSDQIFDICRGVVFTLCLLFLLRIDTSIIYHYIRGQAAIKLYVLYNILEVFDKLCCSFGQDIFDALFCNTTSVAGAAVDAQTQQTAVPPDQAVTRDDVPDLSLLAASADKAVRAELAVDAPPAGDLDTTLRPLKAAASLASWEFKSSPSLFARDAHLLSPRKLPSALLSSLKAPSPRDVPPASQPAADPPLGRLLLGLLSTLGLIMIYVVIHSFVLILQLITLNVAVNSFNSSLLALLMSNQFVELKGSVFKKFEPEHLFQLSCSDIVERFQLSLFLMMVTLKNFSDMEWAVPQHYMMSSVHVFVLVMVSETLVDWIKHAFITKFSAILPDIYFKFSSILSSDILFSSKQAGVLSLDNSHGVSRRIGFVTIPIGCVTAKVIIDVLPFRGMMGAVMLFLMWLCLFAFKILIRIRMLGSCVRNHILQDKQAYEKFSNIQRYEMWRGTVPS